MKGNCKILLSVAGALLLVILVAAMRRGEGQFHTGVSRGRFWIEKLDAPRVYHTVLLGDSRVMCDLSPAAMEELGGPVFNFGFNYVGLTSEYLEAGFEKLDPQVGEKIVVIGFTPRELTPLNVRVSGYKVEKDRASQQRFRSKWLEDYLVCLRPIPVATFAMEMFGVQYGYKDYFSDGWMAVSIVPENPTLDLPVYKRIFIQNGVSPAIQDECFGKFSQWIQQGVSVFGFRPPVSNPIRQVEDEQSGFDEKSIRQRFQAIGGIWLEPGKSGELVFCDGSHLDAFSAIRFSRSIAKAIRREMDQKASGLRKPGLTVPELTASHDANYPPRSDK